MGVTLHILTRAIIEGVLALGVIRDRFNFINFKGLNLVFFDRARHLLHFLSGFGKTVVFKLVQKPFGRGPRLIGTHIFRRLKMFALRQGLELLKRGELFGFAHVLLLERGDLLSLLLYSGQLLGLLIHETKIHIQLRLNLLESLPFDFLVVLQGLLGGQLLFLKVFVCLFFQILGPDKLPHSKSFGLKDYKA